MNLRLQRPQFGLRDQAAHFRFAILLDLFDNLRGRAAQRLQIFTQIAASTGAASQQHMARAAATNANRNDGFDQPWSELSPKRRGSSEISAGRRKSNASQPAHRRHTERPRP